MIFTVAIDGPAAAGKGTIARALAAQFDFAHMDTGLLYRAVGLMALDGSKGIIDPVMAETIAARITPEDLKRDDLRSSRASRAASRVAAMQPVREALLKTQRDFARRDGGAVLDGRDIGTVICPDVEVKLFVIASDQRRAERRHRELAAAGGQQTVNQVLLDLRTRDIRDAGRAAAPMAQAEDAVLLDTTELSIEDAIQSAADLVKARLADGA